MHPVIYLLKSYGGILVFTLSLVPVAAYFLQRRQSSRIGRGTLTIGLLLGMMAAACTILLVSISEFLLWETLTTIVLYIGAFVWIREYMSTPST